MLEVQHRIALVILGIAGRSIDIHRGVVFSHLGVICGDADLAVGHLLDGVEITASLWNVDGTGHSAATEIALAGRIGNIHST